METRYYSGVPERIDIFREEYEFLSNFYPARLCFEGITYRNSEAAFQAQKCLAPALRAEFADLSGKEAKQKGRRVPLRPDWNDVRVEVMRKVVYAKFTQNPSLAQALLDTGDIPLIEGNTWHDYFWGVDLRTGKGQNHLGRILTELRAQLRENSE